MQQLVLLFIVRVGGAESLWPAPLEQSKEIHLNYQ